MYTQNTTAELATPLMRFNLEKHLVDLYLLETGTNVGRLKKIQRDLGGIPNQEALDLICRYRNSVPPNVWLRIANQPILLPGCTQDLKEGYCWVITMDCDRCIVKTQESGLLYGFLIAVYSLDS